MARMASVDVAFLLASGMNILGDTTDLEDTDDAALEEITALGDAPQSYAFAGVDDYVLTQNGFFNDATNRSNDALNNKGASKVMSFAPEGNTLGARMVSVPAVQSMYKRQISRGALHKASASYKPTGSHDEGKIVAPLTARTAASDTTATSLDNSASSANGCAATLQMTDLTLDGYTNIVVKLQHSANNSVWVDLITFTAITAAPAAERKTVTGTVNRYLAAAWAYTGSGTSPTGTWTLGVARG